MKPVYLSALLFLFSFSFVDGIHEVSTIKPAFEDHEIKAWKHRVPVQGNSWFMVADEKGTKQPYDLRSFRWEDDRAVLRTWFYLGQAGVLEFGFETASGNDGVVFGVSFNGEDRFLNVPLKGAGEYIAGTVLIQSPGYYYVDLIEIQKTDAQFPLPVSVLLGGTAAEGLVSFSGPEFFYWGRRGPSVHLSYQVPEEADNILYFYNEVTVPEGNDITGSFYMANGFGQGYFGFQVNSPTERRILFSVWSPYETDNPEEIPEDQRVVNLKRGAGVVINDFGNEGSGGQSFLRYSWKAGVTYGFLLKVEPAKGYTDRSDYTAWFYAPEDGRWQLIASWRRPMVSTHITRVHSFLENFSTRTGPLSRKAYYNNQWVMDVTGRWFELTRARFTADATARAGARLDYAGGIAIDNQGFFMKNCGFFNERSPIDSWFNRKPTGARPEIDFSNLP